MAVVVCPSCGRYNLSDKLKAAGNRCELCQSPIIALPPPSVPVPPPAVPPPADTGPAEFDVTLAAEEDGGWGTFPGRVVAGVGTAFMLLGALVAVAGFRVGGGNDLRWWLVLSACGAVLGTV